MLARPSIDALEPRLREATLKIAARLQTNGAQAWLVGGAVRDMALGKAPKDIDLASDAHPDTIEALFEHTIAVGKAFGTIVVVLDGVEAQVTTFRRERGHHDARRPSEVEFSARLEDDAARRDFTCNALYLDPLSGALADPFGGMEDLRVGVLRAVGPARQRFEEDGLRLVRMARLAASHGLRIEPETFAAASQSLGALRGVSAERRLGELTLIFRRSGATRAVELLDEAGVLEALSPGRAGVAGALPRPWEALARLPAIPGEAAGLAALFDPLGGPKARSAERDAAALRLLDALRPSRALASEVRALWRLQHVVLRASSLGALSRATRIRLVRDPAWSSALALLQVRPEVDQLELERLAQWARTLGPLELRPAPLLSSDDLSASSIPRGPEWKRVLESAEELQLEGALMTRERALEWLALRARAPRDET